MQSLAKTELVGFLELQVGSLAVQVPIRQAEPEDPSVHEVPLATFETEGNAYAILLHGKAPTRVMEQAMGDAAKQAMAHLSRKLLN